MFMIELMFGSGDVLAAIIPLLAIAGLAAAGAGVAGNAITRGKQKRELNKMREGVAAEHAENKAWYNANALSDYTQRADSQNLLKNLRDNLKRRRDATTATAAVTGATPAAQAAAKESDARVISDTYSNLSALGQRYKDNVTDQYFRRKDMLNNRLMGLDQQNLAGYDRMANSWSNLTSTGLNTAAGAFMPAYASMMTQGSPAGSYGKYYQG